MTKNTIAKRFGTYSILAAGALAIASCGMNTAAHLDSAKPQPKSFAMRHPEFVKAESLRDRHALMNVNASNPLRAYDVASYAFDAHFDSAASKLFAKTEIRLHREAGTPKIELDAGVDEIVSITDLAGAALPFEWKRDQELLIVDLSSMSAADVGLRIESVTKASRSGALRFIPARRGDPAQSRVLYTQSEPQSASSWMPCNDRPTDRAHFSITMEVAKDEAVISNGRAAAVEERANSRVFRYATDYDLPTYIMAFAAGQLENQTRSTGRFPISVWYRKGVRVDARGVLDATEQQIRHFESLLGPYAFEKYAVVLLPEFGGGMENVGITFNDENSSSEGSLDSDYLLMAHELGHQWFGDHVTVKDWDDLWIKEGMATLLASEASRAFADTKNTGRLFGSDNWVSDGDAIRDPSLSPGEKYNTGPYDRSAWLLTQIRSLAGETAFWATLRGIQRDKSMSSIGTDEFLETFRPVLGDARLAQVQRAVAAKALPRLSADMRADGVELLLEDADGALVAPLEIQWRSDSGAVQSVALAAGSRLTIPTVGPGLLVFDPRDVHIGPALWMTREDDAADAASRLAYLGFSHLFAPRTAESFRSFLNAPVSQQLLASSSEQIAADWAMNPGDFLSAWMSAGSDLLKVNLTEVGCTLAQLQQNNDPALYARWQKALQAAYATLPTRGMVYSRALPSCWSVIATPALSQRFARLGQDTQSPDWTIPELVKMKLLRLPDDESIAAWGPMALEAPSLRARMTAARELQTQVGELVANAPATPRFSELFRRILSETRSKDLNALAVNNLETLKDLSAAPEFGVYVSDGTLSSYARRSALCAFWRMTDKATKPEWANFTANVVVAGLDNSLKRLIDHPEGCQ